MKKRIGLLLLSVVLSMCMSVPLIADIRVIDDDSIEGRINKVLSQEAWKELDSVELENFLCDIIFLEEEVSNLSEEEKSNIEKLDEALSLKEAVSDELNQRIPSYGYIESEEEKKGFDTVINQSGCDQAGFMPTYIPDKNRLTKTRSQNPYGSCWAHSACAVAEMDAISDGANRNDLDESELHIVNYAYTKRGIKYKGIAGDGTEPIGKINLERGGNYNLAMGALTNWIGFADESVMPYSEASKYTAGIDDFDKAYLDNYHLYQVREFNIKNNPELVKEWILDHGAVGASYCEANKYYYDPGKAYYCDTNYTSNHAITIVGWDDTFSPSNFNSTIRPSSSGAWLVRNSWEAGKDLEEGSFSHYTYFWLSYEDKSLCAAYGFDVGPVNVYDNIHTYDAGSASAMIGYSVATQGANVFYAKDTEELNAVSVQIPSANIDLKIEVYTDLPNPNNPSSGTRQDKCTIETTTGASGYYTFDFAEYGKQSVKIDSDTYFAVVATYGVGADGNACCVCETNFDGGWYKNTAVINRGQSFIKTVGASSWIDILDAEDSDLGNIRIKAFTNNIDGEIVKPTKIEFDDDISAVGVTIDEQESYTPTVIFTPESTTDKRIRWITSDPSIVEVTENGTIKGRLAGIARVTAVSRADSNVKAYFDVTVNAVPRRLILDVNDGETATTVRYLNYGDAYGTLPEPSRKGHEFAGWYTATTGGIKVSSTTIVDFETEKTIYAHWTPKTYTVSFDDNSDRLSLEIKDYNISFGANYKLPNINTEGSSVSFLGWYTEPFGGEKITTSTIMNRDSNHTLYAHWYGIRYTIRFDANGGSCTTYQLTTDDYAKLTYLPVATRTAYSFDGWYLDDQKVTTDTIFNKYVTIKAKWNENHQATAEWYSDGTKHWHKCVFSGCEEIFEESSHTGGTATCISKPVCSICSNEYGTVNASNHTGGTVKKNIKSATCTENGNDGDVYCSSCDAKTANGNVIYATGHSYRTSWSSDATSHYKECSKCGDKISVEAHTGGTATCISKAVCSACSNEYGTVNASNHTGGTVKKNIKSATCTENGNDGDEYCSSCDAKKTNGNVIYATGHSYGTSWNSDATSHYKECSKCGDKTSVEAHAGGTATCIDKAVCSVCSNEYGTVNASNHTGGTVKKNIKSATCTENGNDGDIYCSSCDGKIANGNVIYATGHNHGSAWKNNESEHWKECNTCHARLYLEAHYGQVATCVSKAYCDICETEYGEMDINNHDVVVDEEIKPTCENDGLSVGSHCANCGKVLSERVPLLARGHKLDSGTVILEPTEKTTGIYRKKCLNDGCSYIVDTVIPAKENIGDIVNEDLDLVVEHELLDTTINVVGVKDVVYTGKAQTFDIRVYVGKTLLKEGTDYSVTYANNVNASTSNELYKKPKVLIIGKGKYRNSTKYNFAPIYFEIKPIDIAELSENGICNVSNDYAIKGTNPVNPQPSVTIDGKKLSKNKDYDVIYVDHAGGYTEPSTEPYKIVIRGKNNYIGEITSNFTLIDDQTASLMSTASVSGVKKLVYDGTEKKQTQLVVKAKVNGKKRQLQSSEYTIEYKNNVEIGTATMIIRPVEGLGLMGEKTVTFKITGTPISKMTFTYDKKLDYTGQTIKPGAPSSPELNVYDKYANRKLVYGKDYDVEYQKNIQAGTAVMLITGKGAYSGTAKKTFKINAININENTGIAAKIVPDSIKIATEGKYKDKYTASVSVTFNGKPLIEGKDYTLSFKNNEKLEDSEKVPEVIVKGMGNYKKSISILFTVK